MQFGEATVGAIFGNYVNWLASDRDGDALTYAMDSGPSWLQLVNAQYGRIEGTPSAEHVGENVAIISVTDGVNPPVSVRLEIKVLPTP